MNPIIGLISTLFQPLADSYKANQERKAAKEAAIVKIQQTQLEDANKVTLTDAEWEALAVANLNTSWKDEYVTIIITAPIVGILLGGLWTGLTGSKAVLEGMAIGLTSLASVGVDMGFLMNAVVLAAIGLKVWRK
jgi:hypothetical protein